jgi:transcriptional regulator with XRE-family HTH domain
MEYVLYMTKRGVNMEVSKYRQPICDVLKMGRKKAGMTTNEVAVQLEEYGLKITGKSLYSYESGQNEPTARMFLALLEIYKLDNINFAQPQPETPEHPIFTRREMNLINLYRLLNEHGKSTVDCITEHEYISAAKEASIGIGSVIDDE